MFNILDLLCDANQNDKRLYTINEAIDFVKELKATAERDPNYRMPNLGEPDEENVSEWLYHFGYKLTVGRMM